MVSKLPHFTPQDIARWTGGTWCSDRMPEVISGFCFDARQLRADECFVALSGGARDGHDFVAQAVELGASAVLVERPQASSIPQLIVADSLVALGAIGGAVRSGFPEPVVGISGSCGKTSTKEMLRELLGEARTHATAGNWNNRIGVPMTLLGLDAESHNFAVIEAGINQPGEMHALGAIIHADLSLITNIASAHLELLGSVENVAAEKAQLALRAVEGSSVILPADVMRYPAFQKLSTRAIVLVEAQAELKQEVRRVVRYSINPTGSTHTLTLSDGDLRSSYSISSASAGITLNAALAIVAARELGISETDIRDRIERWQAAPNRGRVVRSGARTFYVDCYNANPASMRDALDAFRRATSQAVARCYILGGMNELGVEAAALHRQIGQGLNLRSEDRAIFVGPSELTAAYFEGARAAGVSSTQLQAVPDVEKIKSGIADFEGAIFLKGSRAYALEELLPTGGGSLHS